MQSVAIWSLTPEAHVLIFAPMIYIFYEDIVIIRHPFHWQYIIYNASFSLRPAHFFLTHFLSEIVQECLKKDTFFFLWLFTAHSFFFSLCEIDHQSFSLRLFMCLHTLAHMWGKKCTAFFPPSHTSCSCTFQSWQWENFRLSNGVVYESPMHCPIWQFARSEKAGGCHVKKKAGGRKKKYLNLNFCCTASMRRRRRKKSLRKFSAVVKFRNRTKKNWEKVWSRDCKKEKVEKKLFSRA